MFPFPKVFKFQKNLFQCFDNIGLCLLGTFCPCYVNGKTAEAVGDECLLCCVGYCFLDCIAGALTRQKVRQYKGIQGSILEDLLIHCFCPCCAVIQDNAEMGANACP